MCFLPYLCVLTNYQVAYTPKIPLFACNLSLLSLNYHFKPVNKCLYKQVFLSLFLHFSLYFAAIK